MVCTECDSKRFKKGGQSHGKTEYTCLKCGFRTINPEIGNVLVIGDTHVPAVRADYLQFCAYVYGKYDCSTVVHIGDVVDFHNINFHTHSPDFKGANDELTMSRETLREWSKAFPQMFVCTGNHDLLVYRKATANGLPKEFFKSFNEILGTPDTWEWNDEWCFDGVKYSHGAGLGGMYPHRTAMNYNRQPCVTGHAHAVAGIEYGASKKDLVWGMAVGSGVDDKSILFDYGRDVPRRSIISCGVVLDGGRVPIIEPMELN